jgi:hypothetical protein
MGVVWDESDTAAPSPEQISKAAEESRILAQAIGALTRSRTTQKGAATKMTPLDAAGQRNLRAEVRLDPLVEEALRYITLPWPRHDPEGALNDLGSNRNRSIPIVILEQMVLDGVTRRQNVADFLAATFDSQQFDVL